MNPLRVVSTYTPTLPATRWEPIQTFVREVVRAYTPGRTSRAAGDAMSVMTYFADWVNVTSVVPLEEAFAENVIDAYTEERMQEVSATVAQRERKLLRTLGGYPPIVERDRPVSTTSQAAAPYSAVAIRRLIEWARGQHTEPMRQSCMAILILSAGAGLTAQSMGEVRRSDIRRGVDGGPVVRAHLPERTVPIVDQWAAHLSAVGPGEGYEYLIAPSASMRASVVRGVIGASHGDVVPSPQRLRVTWAVAQLNAGTHIGSFLHAAGLTAADSLKRFLPYVEPLTELDRLSSLRLGGGEH